jgi:AsmA protein
VEANGTLSVGSVQVASLTLQNVRVTVTTQNDVTRLFPLTAEVDGGHYSGDVTVDHHAPLAVVSVDEHLSGVDVGRLMALEPRQIRLSGRASINLKATGRGADADAVFRTLDGHVDTRITQGALEGVDLGYQFGRAEALLQRQNGARASDTGRTPFDAFQMSAQITGGVAATHDLLISAAALKVTGEGTANLATQALDLALLADTRKTLGGTPIQLPVTVRGTFASPDIRPDLQALARGELKEKVKDLLKERLQDLFGRP